MARTRWSEKQSAAAIAASEQGLMSWAEIGARLGISRNRAWQLCKRAEDKIAAALTGQPTPKAPRKGQRGRQFQPTESEAW